MMFSTNPFAQFASSIQVFPPPNSFLENEKNDFYINNHHHLNNPFISGDCCLHPYSPSFTTISKQDSGGIVGVGLEKGDDEHYHVLGSEVSPREKMKQSKKDHHSKIYTAQGPRDRRVRLSIDVARKFFFLQDLLGFDKASKTLDWLFNKSKILIDELIQGRKQSSSPTATDEFEVLFLESLKEGSDEEGKGQKRKSAPKCSNGKRMKITRKYKSEVPVNQSRAEARARARERTKEKLINKKIDDESKKIYGDCCSCCPESPSYLKLQTSFLRALESQNHHNQRFGEYSLMEEKISMLHSYQYNHHSSINLEL